MWAGVMCKKGGARCALPLIIRLAGLATADAPGARKLRVWARRRRGAHPELRLDGGDNAAWAGQCVSVWGLGVGGGVFVLGQGAVRLAVELRSIAGPMSWLGRRGAGAGSGARAARRSLGVAPVPVGGRGAGVIGLAGGGRAGAWRAVRRRGLGVGGGALDGAGADARRRTPPHASSAQRTGTCRACSERQRAPHTPHPAHVPSAGAPPPCRPPMRGSCCTREAPASAAASRRRFPRRRQTAAAARRRWRRRRRRRSRGGRSGRPCVRLVGGGGVVGWGGIRAAGRFEGGRGAVGHWRVHTDAFGCVVSASSGVTPSQRCRPSPGGAQRPGGAGSTG